MWVYRQTETSPALYTVGFYSPSGHWEPDSDHQDQEKAAARVSFLNGKGPTVDKRAAERIGEAAVFLEQYADNLSDGHTNQVTGDIEPETIAAECAVCWKLAHELRALVDGFKLPQRREGEQ